MILLRLTVVYVLAMNFCWNEKCASTVAVWNRTESEKGQKEKECGNADESLHGERFDGVSLYVLLCFGIFRFIIHVQFILKKFW